MGARLLCRVESLLRHIPGQIKRADSSTLRGRLFLFFILRPDYVIVDTPPLGSVIDGAVVGAICDGTVLVVESGAISYKFAQNVKEQLDKVGCRILGCVLNKVNTKKNPYYGKYYGYYYGSYYGYGQDGADEAQDELMLDAGSQTDATASETGTAAPQQSTEEKGDAK